MKFCHNKTITPTHFKTEYFTNQPLSPTKPLRTKSDISPLVRLVVVVDGGGGGKGWRGRIIGNGELLTWGSDFNSFPKPLCYSASKPNQTFSSKKVTSSSFPKTFVHIETAEFGVLLKRCEFVRHFHICNTPRNV